MERKLRYLGVVTRFNEQMGGQNLTLGTDRDGDEINIRLVPLSGQVLLRYRGHWLLTRPQRQPRRSESEQLLGYSHSLTFRMLSGSRAVVPALLQDAYDFTAGPTARSRSMCRSTRAGDSSSDARPARWTA